MPHVVSDVPTMVDTVPDMVAAVPAMVATVPTVRRAGQVRRTACDVHRQCHEGDENQETFHCRILPIRRFFEFGRLRS